MIDATSFLYIIRKVNFGFRVKLGVGFQKQKLKFIYGFNFLIHFTNQL